MWKVNTNMCRQCRRTGNVVIFCCTRAGNGVYRLIVLLLDLKKCQNGKMLCKDNNICTTSLPIEHGPWRKHCNCGYRSKEPRRDIGVESSFRTTKYAVKRIGHYYNSTLKLGFHICGKRERHALSVIRQKWKSM